MIAQARNIQRNRGRRMMITDPSFEQYLNDRYPGTIIWHGQEQPPATAAQAFNRNVAGLADSMTFPGTNPLNGTYNGVTLGQPFGGNIPYAPSYDGNNDLTNIYSAALNTAFSGASGSIHTFVQVSGVGVWTDATLRVIVAIEVDNNNRVRLVKQSNIDRLQLFYVSGGTNKNVIITTDRVDRFLLSMTWDKPTDQMIVYINGVKTGSTQTGLGVWAGNLDPAKCVLGALTTAPSNIWDGFITEVILHPTRAMSQPEIIDIYRESGLPA